MWPGIVLLSLLNPLLINFVLNQKTIVFSRVSSSMKSDDWALRYGWLRFVLNCFQESRVKSFKGLDGLQSFDEVRMVSNKAVIEVSLVQDKNSSMLWVSVGWPLKEIQSPVLKPLIWLCHVKLFICSQFFGLNEKEKRQ